MTEKDAMMITLISRWELLDGCPLDLKQALDGLAERVREKEPDTWMYMVHLQAPAPLDADNNPIEPPLPAIPLAQQTEVTFVEIYKDESAFSRHVKGSVFQSFLKEYSHYFKQDPARPGWPATLNTTLARVSGVIRDAACRT
ncbi:MULTISPECIES: putative quinol monooxygenase [Pseudomonas]|uniref:putative quinol monooxygenase n=1 Tax=Pseudomonas TaxID=286 RepID=UPI0005FC14D6|nr:MULTISPECIES: hypothetical protein [Pseudomonas]KJZ51351.1 hypothetical protein VC37_23725 [Pseudomonas marginalis]KJZ54832.1 hypothetical protein VC36_24220 [Pseudomonas marginalis]PLR61663.1 hypothetical protein QCBJ_19395 [Pseudomonas sp. QC2]WPN20920.1 hypothetical protein QMK57_15970 [Pseudomonas marginalis]